MARKETPDIMAEMMSDHKTIKHENNKTIKHESEKERATYNLSKDVLNDLEEAWMNLRGLFKDKARITKTLIVEKAIEIAIRDLQSNSRESELFKEINE